MLDGVSVQVKLVAGAIEVASATVPVNALTGLTVIKAVPWAPALTETEVVEDVRSKFGTDATTFSVIVCTSEPLVPVTFTRKEPAIEALTVRVETAVPPFTSVTLGGLRDPETPAGRETDNATVPAKLARLDNVIVDVPSAFTATAIVEGDATIVKSFGGTVTKTSTIRVSEPLIPVTFTL